MSFGSIFSALKNMPEADTKGVTLSSLDDSVLALETVAIDGILAQNIREVAHSQGNGELHLTKEKMMQILRDQVSKQYCPIPSNVLNCIDAKENHNTILSLGYAFNTEMSIIPTNTPDSTIDKGMVVYGRAKSGQGNRIMSEIYRHEVARPGTSQYSLYRNRCAQHCAIQAFLLMKPEALVDYMETASDKRDMRFIDHEGEELNPNHPAWILKIYQEGRMDEFLDVVGYEQDFYAPDRYSQIQNGWNSRPWMSGNYNHRADFSVHDFRHASNEHAVPLGAMFIVWRRLLSNTITHNKVPMEDHGLSALGLVLKRMGYKVKAKSFD